MNIVGNKQAVQDKISYLSQRFGLYEDLTVAENMNFYADLHGVEKSIRRERFPHLPAMMMLEQFTAQFKLV